MNDACQADARATRPALRWAAAAAAALVCIAGLFVVNGRPAPEMAVIWLAAILRDGLIVAAWWVAAAGFGVWLTRWLPVGPTRTVVTLAVGGAVLIVLSWYAAWFGGLRGLTPNALLGAGWLALIAYIVVRRGAISGQAAVPGPPWWAALAAPGIALLVVPATVAPGVLWSPTEFGGYDALSYHLQLPKEWLAAGAMVPTPHNAYGYLPNGLEAVFAQVMAVRGSAVGGAIACQLLHASFALLAAAAIGAAVYQLCRSAAGAWLAAAIYLAVPWTMVTGTLAYNEQAMVALGAAAVLLAMVDEPARPTRAALLAGLLCGAAVVVKPTAAGMFALPVAVLVLATPHGFAVRSRSLAAMVAGGAVVVAGWLVRSVRWGALMPPYIEGWQPDQVARWNAAHRPDLSFGERLARLWDMVVAHDQFAYIVWPMAIVAAAWLVTRKPCRLRLTPAKLVAVAIVQLTFWLTFTHLQSRFMLPALVPACVLIGMAIAARDTRAARAAGALVAATAVVVSARLWFVQADGRAAGLVDATAMVAHSQPLNDLPDGSRVYAEAFATPFYIGVPLDYRTVWDRSPLGEAMHGSGARAGLRWLQQHGYTHVAIDFGMLARWRSPGNYGYDALVTPQRLEALLMLGFQPVGEPLPGGFVICRVPQ